MRNSIHPRNLVTFAFLIGLGLPVAAQMPSGLGKHFLSAPLRVTDPRYVGSQPFDVLRYKIDLSPAMRTELLEGRVSITMVLTSPLDSIRLNAASLQLDSIRVDGVERPARIDSVTESFTVGLGVTRSAGDTLRINIAYRRLPGVKRPGSRRGYYYFTPSTVPGLPEVLGYTLSEPSDARYWLPCYDEPWDKATAELNITVPPGYAVASNGRLLGVTGSRDEGITWHWREDHQVATYLLSFVASRLTISSLPYARASGDTLPVQYFVWGADSAVCAAYLPTVRQMLGVYASAFGEYPFDKYGMTAVTPFSSGGMEHQTITTMLRNVKTDELVVAHELAHQWWGDLVTCGTWKDIWLNESFATYAEAIWKESTGGATARGNLMKQKEHFNFGSWQGAAYDPQGQGFNLFSDLVYNKGGWILHTLRGMIGDSLFFRGLRAYRQQYAGGNAITAEFESILESVSGRDLSWFFNQWVFGKGWPQYAFRHTWGADTLALTIYQQQPPAWPTYTMPIRIRAYKPGRDTTFIIQNNRRNEVYRIPLPFAPDSVKLDPDGWILKQIVSAPAGVEASGAPASFRLDQNWPNPFNPQTEIGYSVPEPSGREGVSGGEGRFLTSGWVSLRVYDVLGREIATLVNERKPAGTYTVRFDGTGLPSGAYLCRLQAGAYVATQRMMLLK